MMEGKVQSRWCMPNQNVLKSVVLIGKRKGTGHLAASFNGSSQSGRLSRVLKSLSSSQHQLRSLDDYFVKRHNDGNGNGNGNGMQPCSSSASKRKELLDRNDHFEAKKGLTSLEDYFWKLNKDANSKKYLSSRSGNENSVSVSAAAAAPSSYIKKVHKTVEAKKLRSDMQLKEKHSGVADKIADDETSNFYLIGILASINIAVFLFEIASPITNSDLQLFSLPSAYGAKINQFILVGEWWRLVTPMFLHSGLFHIGLSCWMLVTFGPQVCRAYGAFNFFLIYVLGGLSGNLISFLHTSDPTVGGTGPVFAIIGALISYQIQNRDLLGNNASENMLQKAIIATCLSCTLSNFGPVDDWTHIGAALTGLAYGFFTSPTIQVDDKTSESGQEEGIRLVTRYADSCKSFVYFCFFILLWYSLLFVIDPPLSSLVGDDLNIGM